MSDNYPSDVKLDENPDGSVSFATGVVETIAGLAAQEVEGVSSMASVTTGFADIFSKKSSRNFTKGVRVDIDGNMVAVDVTIVVEYGSPVPDVARSIQENIKKAIETMSGLDVRNVDVHVQGVSFERENRAVQELKEHQQQLLEKSGEQAREEAPAEDVLPADKPAEETIDEIDEMDEMDEFDDLEEELEEDDEPEILGDDDELINLSEVPEESDEGGEGDE